MKSYDSNLFEYIDSGKNEVMVRDEVGACIPNREEYEAICDDVFTTITNYTWDC